MMRCSTRKKILVTLASVVLVVVAVVVHALAGLSTQPILYAAPPAFVAQYAENMQYSEPSSLVKVNATAFESPEGAHYTKWMQGFSYEEALVFKAIMAGESLDELWGLFAHPDKAVRIKIASAFAAVNIKFSHHDESGFPPKRNQFWKDLGEQLPNVRNALSEGLIETAKHGTATRIPYTLAWLPEMGTETLKLFEWAAKHHPDPNVRRSSMYYVAYIGREEEFSAPLLLNRAHDPDYSVRKLALGLRFRRLVGDL
ncbi:HEAT repeat domain-containing protein [Pseudoalteromonas sp. JBTF-M23]|uniref:HEAT repeat domain-containing protein n=1 Tax=Pseudoalteromonas caenipelagi TaxID=2726988 RepID=A0A849VHD5_9GAMM|nr:HEAT repeat domain-containing protein [Pseudoalteromonas caenipelagi]NOU51274.1 HEAT repeat domain-containing protein [Pseudoalteromonas caenipelagi]